MTRAYHRWSQADDKRLEDLWASGVRGDVRLAADLGVTAGAVLKRRHELGLVPYRRQPWTAEDDDQVTTLARDGLTSSEISRRLTDPRSASSVRARLATLRAAVPVDGPPLILVGCTKGKRRGHCRADELYLGRMFAAALAWARTQAGDDQIRVLSALHGLVRLDEEIAWYDKTLAGARPRRQWAVRVTEGIAELRPARVVVLAGQSYVAPWRALVAAQIEEPLAGLACGPRYARLIEMTKASGSTMVELGNTTQAGR